MLEGLDFKLSNFVEKEKNIYTHTHTHGSVEKDWSNGVTMEII